ncbi:MAG: hypothetical protein KJ621_00740 [Proteobacteria bacterium]|nr:hypothetical protein [Pseudomonadota bacterium]
MKKKLVIVVVVIFWLTLLVLMGATALAGQAAADAGSSLTAATPGAAIQVSKIMIRCVRRCRTFVARKRCRPRTACRFVTHLGCGCVLRGGRCLALCQSRVLVRRCNPKGWCRAGVSRCRCYRVPFRPVPPRPPR